MTPSGHHVAITGGSRGIGLALAQKFLSHGNAVLVIARDRDRLAAVAAAEPRITTLAADLAEPAGIERIADFIAGHFPALNVLVNNAGVHHPGDLAHGVSAEAVGHAITVNVTAPVLLTRALLARLEENAPAAVVNVSSSLAIAPKQADTVYGATKAFIRNFSVALRYQQEGRGVRVFDLMPPAVDTDMMAGRAMAKMAPEALAEGFWKCWLKDDFEAVIGRARRIRAINRLSPARARRMLRGI